MNCRRLGDVCAIGRLAEHLYCGKLELLECHHQHQGLHIKSYTGYNFVAPRGETVTSAPGRLTMEATSFLTSNQVPASFDYLCSTTMTSTG